VYDQQGGTKRPLTPAELRKISRSTEYHQAFVDYMKKNKDSAAKAAVVTPAGADTLLREIPDFHNASAVNNNEESNTKTPCAKTVRKFYQLQDKIISGDGGGSTQTF
jgi:hypothetical protein